MNMAINIVQSAMSAVQWHITNSMTPEQREEVFRAITQTIAAERRRCVQHLHMVERTDANKEMLDQLSTAMLNGLPVEWW